AQVLDLLAETEAEGWDKVNERGGVVVHRKFMKGSGWGSQFACVKATYEMRARPDAVVELFADNQRVSEYNK
ncbi:unnamed protein product, partial [Phaeothamnion confervicola]